MMKWPQAGFACKKGGWGRGDRAPSSPCSRGLWQETESPFQVLVSCRTSGRCLCRREAPWDF